MDIHAFVVGPEGLRAFGLRASKPFRNLGFSLLSAFAKAPLLSVFMVQGLEVARLHGRKVPSRVELWGVCLLGCRPGFHHRPAACCSSGLNTMRGLVWLRVLLAPHSLDDRPGFQLLRAPWLLT